MRPFLLAAVTGLAAAAVLLNPVSATAAQRPASDLSWSACPDGTARVPDAELECTSVRVPVDYRDPSGETIEIVVSRLASTAPAERRGVLLVNPGGPGNPGLGMPATLAGLGAPASLLDKYDVIGFDPRGVGRSAPVSCGFETDQGYLSNIPPYAVHDADVTDHAARARDVARQCADSASAPLLPHLTTANTARDMDRIRSALGERKISYFGASYGTALGAAYASLFPERTDRVVLDSNLGTTTLDQTAMRRLGIGAEQRFPDFAKYAAARSETYEIGGTPAQVRRNYFDLIRRLDEHPVGGIDGATFPTYMSGALYDDDNFPSFAQLWQSLDRADDAAVRRLLRSPALAAAPSPVDQVLSSQLAVICADSDWSENLATYRAHVRQDRVRHPLYGPAAASVTPCAYWPNEPVEPLVRVNPKGPANVLVLQNLRDPATPAVGARDLRAAFGDRARLVTVDQAGHGVYLFDDNPCGLDVTTAYLVHGDFPATDRHCAASDESGLKLTSAQQRLRKATLREHPLP